MNRQESMNRPGEQVMKKEDVLEQVATGELSVEEAAKLLMVRRSTAPCLLYCKVSPKGGLSL